MDPFLPVQRLLDDPHLRCAPSEVRAAYWEAVLAVWQGYERTGGKPRIERGSLPFASSLIDAGLVRPFGKWIEIPWLTEQWRASASRHVTFSKTGTPPAPKNPEELLLSLQDIRSGKSARNPKLTQPSVKAHRCPKDWQPNLDHVALADNLHVDFHAQLDWFRDFEFARAHSDWDATFRNWIRTAAERGPARPHRSGRLTPEEAIAEYDRRRESLRVVR